MAHTAREFFGEACFFIAAFCTAMGFQAAAEQPQNVPDRGTLSTINPRPAVLTETLEASRPPEERNPE